MLKTPTGRKIRKDRGKKRLTAKQEQKIEAALDAVKVGDPADLEEKPENPLESP